MRVRLSEYLSRQNLGTASYGLEIAVCEARAAFLLLGSDVADIPDRDGAAGDQKLKMLAYISGWSFVDIRALCRTVRQF